MMEVNKEELRRLIEEARNNPSMKTAYYTESGPDVMGELLDEIDRLHAESEILRKDAERSQRMLLAACMDMGAIGNALNADMNADGDELLGMVVDINAENKRLRLFLSEISKTSGDKGAVMGARHLLEEFGQ